MATCDLTAGHSLSCRDNTGGVNAVYILSGSISTIAETSGEITGITGSGAFFKFEMPRGVASFTETPNASVEAGTVFYDQTVSMAVHKLQTSLRNQVKQLAANPDLKVVIETNNGASDYVGKFIYCGRYRGLTVNGGTGATGVAFGDSNSYTVTLNGQEPEPFFEVQSTDGTLASALSGISVS